ncbi:hypothetical protein ACJX0J_030219, partial [Zea mays]
MAGKGAKATAAKSADKDKGKKTDGPVSRSSRAAPQTTAVDFKPYVGPIYNAILGRLVNQDQDQEVKECAISCMSLVVSTFGDGLERELPACLPILVDRM